MNREMIYLWRDIFLNDRGVPDVIWHLLRTEIGLQKVYQSNKFSTKLKINLWKDEKDVGSSIVP